MDRLAWRVRGWLQGHGERKISWLILVVSTLFFLSEAVYAQKEISPTITIESAIAEAKRYALQKEINVEGKYIKKVEYHNNIHSPDGRPYWLIYWENRKVTKGGGVELKLYGDGSIEEKYYK